MNEHGILILLSLVEFLGLLYIVAILDYYNEQRERRFRDEIIEEIKRNAK